MPSTVDLFLIELPTYTALVMLGVVAGLGIAYGFWRARVRGVPAGVFIDGAVVALMAGWLGARAYHVAMHWDYYAGRPDEIAQIGLGGLAMRGALLAGFCAVWLYARWRGVRFARLADAAALGLCVGQAMGWGGALAQGFNYGVVSDSPVALDLPDIYGLYAPRFPLQHSEIVLFIGLLGGLALLAARHPQAGTLSGVYVLVSSAANFVLGFQRGDEARAFAGLRGDQWVDAAMCALALMFFIVRRRGGNGGIN